MNYIYLIFIIAVILIICGVALNYFQKKSNKTESVKPVLEKKSNKVIEPTPVSHELNALRQELMTIVLHNQRIYQSNLEIARRDFSKRNIQNPSETNLIKRAIEIWRDDNR